MAAPTKSKTTDDTNAALVKTLGISLHSSVFNTNKPIKKAYAAATADASVGVKIPPNIPPKIITGVINGKNAFRDALPLIFQEDFNVALGRSYLFANNLTMTIKLIPTIKPGTIPAKNNAATLSPIT